jgi:hypothetical protein
MLATSDNAVWQTVLLHSPALLHNQHPNTIACALQQIHAATAAAQLDSLGCLWADCQQPQLLQRPKSCEPPIKGPSHAGHLIII